MKIKDRIFYAGLYIYLIFVRFERGCFLSFQYSHGICIVLLFIFASETTGLYVYVFYIKDTVCVVRSNW